MTYATITDIQDRLGRELDEHETTLATARLSDAETLIRSRIPDLDDRVQGGILSRDIVVMIEAEAVLRVLRNPQGFSQETDGNYSYSMSSLNAPGRVLISDDEWRMLGARAGAFVIRPNFDTSPWYRKPFNVA